MLKKGSQRISILIHFPLITSNFIRYQNEIDGKEKNPEESLRIAIKFHQIDQQNQQKSCKNLHEKVAIK